MKIETAIAQLNREQEFLGIGLLKLLQDIQRHGRMVYSEQTVKAYHAFMVQGSRMFAPV